MSTIRVRANIAGGVAVLVALLLVGWFVVLGPRLASASEISDQIEQLDASNVAMQNHYRQVLEQTQTVTKAAADAQALFATMPQQADLPEVLVQIIDAAKGAGIDGKQISVINASVPRSITGDSATGVDPESAAGVAAKGLGLDLAQLDLDVTVSGSRPQLLRFVENVQGLDRAILITASTLTDLAQATSGGPAHLTRPGADQSLQLTGSMFVLQSKLPDIVAKVQSLIAKAGVPTVTAAPTTTAPTTTAPTPAVPTTAVPSAVAPTATP